MSKHTVNVNSMSIKDLYDFILRTYKESLPQTVTILNDIPNIDDYEYLKDEIWVSKDKIELNVYKPELGIINPQRMYVYIKFAKITDEIYAPVHLQHIDNES